MWILSVCALSLVFVLCVLGIWHQSFRENLLQFIGMSWLMVACAGRIAWLWEAERVEPSWMLVHVGMAIYAAGTALKVVIHHGRACGWSSVLNFDRWLTHRKTLPGVFDDKPHHHH